jgi:hypothetical protein
MTLDMSHGIQLHVRSVWRHWGCTTPKILSNMKVQFSSADELDGFEDLNDEDKDRVRHAFDEGKVADEDIPETARKAGGDDEAEEGEEKPKKKRAPPKKKAEADADDEEKPKRKRVTKAKKADETDGDEAKPKKAPARKSRAKVRAIAHFRMVFFIFVAETCCFF